MVGCDIIRTEVEKIDTSLMASSLAIANPALLNEFDKVSEILEDIIGKEIDVSSVKTWPLFIQYRQSNEFQEFISKHKDLFEVETCSAEDVSCLSEKKEIPDVPKEKADKKHGVIFIDG